MSQLLIQQYRNQLHDLKKVSGTNRESVVREAFKDLLKGYGKQHDLVFIPEYEIETKTKERRYADGALLYELRVPFGYWEAKDEKDDLDAEIEYKFKRGYPQDNIIFEDSLKVVLIQNKEEVMRCAADDAEQLEKLLKLFFSYTRVEIAEFRKAVEQFRTDLPEVLKALREMIDKEEKLNPKFRKESARFLKHAQDAINPSLTAADVREMLIQHVLTEEIFSKVFDDSDFHQHNNVARELYKLEGTFFTGSLKKTTLKGLETYYAAIRAAAAQISNHHEKQTFLKVIYENFYKVYNVKAADRLGVVYTPNEIVRFMIESADWLCEKHFGKSLIDKDVEILDPATGTGTFICELLEHFRGSPAKLKHKYAHELHANEVAILPYYVANLNIEATYAAITGEYKEFENLCFVDTLDNVGLHTQAHGSTGELFGSVSEENVERIKRQNKKKISVIIGNPPYRANQANENDNNKNRKYPAIDQRIKATYIAESSAQKTKAYDMLMRFYRWASDRVSDDGVIAFVTNRSFIDKSTHDGFRKSLTNEFNYAYVVDLGGEMLDGDSKGNVFGIKVGVAILFLVKQNDSSNDVMIKMTSITNETASERLTSLSSTSLSSLPLEFVKPDKNGNWTNFGNVGYDKLMQLEGDGRNSLIYTSTLGISTNRDDWLVGETKDIVNEKMRYFVEQYQMNKPSTKTHSDNIKWSETLKRRLRAGEREKFSDSHVVEYCYRPFSSAHLYDSELFIDRPAQQRNLFSQQARDKGQLAIIFTGPGSQKPFMVLSVAQSFDLHIVGSAAGSCGIPLLNCANQVCEPNITDWGLKQFTERYKTLDSGLRRNDKPKITKEDIFHYCYAVLHDPVYREKYALNLKREFPRIPFYADFWQWAAWGRR